MQINNFKDIKELYDESQRLEEMIRNIPSKMKNILMKLEELKQQDQCIQKRSQ